ncbi:acyl-CoA dehydrogenase family protein, partial [Escherichia coli]|uniref:acyl-CoA dehydrogenase family protein n=1 Tax=Escherichia coli TaxID=562 RepID=UPI00211917BF
YRAPSGAGLGAAHQGEWPWSYLFARALTIGGGTTQVQRNILAEQVLGWPREPAPSGATAPENHPTEETP